MSSEDDMGLEPMEGLDDELPEGDDVHLYEDLEEAQRMREMAGDAGQPIGEDEEAVAEDASGLVGVLEMREEDDLMVGLAADELSGADQGAGQAPGQPKANAERITRPFLSKYERTRIIGTRATQIAMGAAPMVELGEETDPLRIAEKELLEFRVPLVVRRYLPDGSFEDWTVAEMNPQRLAAATNTQ